MHVILSPMGSHGDVHPFVAIGRALVARGDRVTLNTSAHFAELATRHCFDFAPIGTNDDYEKLIHDPDLWHPSRCLSVLFGGEVFERHLRESYHNIATRHVPGETIVLGGSLGLASRLAHEKLGVPYLSVHLQPTAILSVVEPPKFAAGNLPSWSPLWFRRAVFWYADRFLLDPMMMPPMNRLRAELGLPKIKRVFGPWRHSPMGILACFPKWYAHPPDYPAQLRHVGFLRYDQEEKPMPADVEAFLQAGEKPVVISLGSAMRQGKPYFTAAVQAFEKLGVRGLILAKRGDQIPENLPKTVMQADYVPFSQVLPRCRALIHHGGIGTTAQALTAGLPQFIMPMAFDQPDNADRLEKLGVARWLKPQDFQPDRVAAVLETLLQSDAVREAVRTQASRMTQEPDSVSATLAAIDEAMANKRL
ncbi:MAG: glycosyltransferase [Fimbriiglobus sp.]